ncbi:MAG: DUF1326 domain-containing protein [Planctomycetes bacterium]|nr:DUF1326 domain-containing protein [Planctomycetota bacterium]
MRIRCLTTLFAALMLTVSTASAAKISGEYLEARTCDVYTGPCFANAEMDLAGKEALMAWRIDKGSWNNVSLDGLTAALVVNSEWTLGYDGVFPMRPGKIKSVILIDKNANPEQRKALVAFVKDSAKKLTGTVKKIKYVSMSLTNNHLDGKGVFTAGKIARIETRAIKESDCVCSNEIVYYLPLTKVKNFRPAYLKTMSYQGDGLNNRWTHKHIRSAFLATFRR